LACSTWILIGDGSLLAGCGDILLREGQQIAAVVTSEMSNVRWATEKGIRIAPSDCDLAALLQDFDFDHLASIAHLSVIPADALRRVKGLAINFHDGPLPELAGLNVTSWAILRGERTHGVTWHVMTERLDAGRILEERRFDVAADDTAFLLNAKCYAAGLESFADLVARVSAGDLSGREQCLTGRQYFGRWARPAAAAVIDWQASGEEISSLVRALDFGPQPNPLCLPKLFLGDRFVAVRHATALDEPSQLVPGKIVSSHGEALRVATRTVDVVLSGLLQLEGTPLDLNELAGRHGLVPGHALPLVEPALGARLTDLQARAAPSEEAWRAVLGSLSFADLDIGPAAVPASAPGCIPPSLLTELPAEGRTDAVIAAIAVLAVRKSGATTLDLAYSDADIVAGVQGTYGAFASCVPLRVTIDRRRAFDAVLAAIRSAREQVRRRGPLSLELWSRYPELQVVAQGGGLGEASVSIGVGTEPPPGRLRFLVSSDGLRCELLSDAGQLSSELAAVIGNAVATPARPVSEIDLMTPDQQALALREWNDTSRPVGEACIHQLIAEQARTTPEATALIFQGERMTYRELDGRTNRLARHLQELGVGPDTLVGIFVQRSFAMVEAVLATLKAGGAYVPLDPTYPSDRLTFMAEDAELGIILTDESLRSRVPSATARVVILDESEPEIDRLSDTPLVPVAGPSNLAYVIYTSGSTGRPKGVMIEHRNVANFAVAMDEHIDTTAERKTWLAVTSLSFDISVLELLWTLARGFEVVLHRDADREGFVAVPAARRPADFSLFYFSSNESEHEQDKYRLLLEGARFADENGFVAVWTPERHFHAFGGLFPNPAVTSAAVAATTKRIGIRAGSVVSPLHSVLRIAEEWSIVDNLSNGRVAISFAPGWQPNDFVLQPENFRNRKDLMFEQIEQVRKLWRGEALPFGNGTGDQIEVRVLPRPVQKELPVWVTIAGNPESFVAAAKAGANVLTHLLGQTVKEVGEKIALYRRTWRDAGHAGMGTVTMMVHTFIGASDAEVKDIVRGPMKEYLRSAVGLIKEAAWSFPTIKQKATNAHGEFNPGGLSAEDMDALLEYAFDRYYSTSGLFGSIETGRRFVDQLTEIGVDEVACLIDFGVSTDTVLASLPQVAQVTAAFRRDVTSRSFLRPAAESIPSLIQSHGVTHLQCTPTMAQILLQDEEGRPALACLRHMLVGGEALPGSLARELALVVAGRVTNMYGPTETTVWSSLSAIARDLEEVTIGFPIANTSLHVVDRDGRLAPVGQSGELLIGGSGVVRGYWKRPDLTSERFIANPFGDGRLYRTGDLVRRRSDGAIHFLGRLDHQVKVRGHRIELGEIEARLREHDSIQETIVVARNEGAGAELVAYVIPRNGVVDETELRTHLRTRVPEYMMPRAFVKLSAFPLTPNRKIDRKALPAPERVAVAVAAEARPENNLEQTIAAIWCEVLELPEVGVDTNFADVGGHSLAMVRVLGRLKERVEAPVSLVDLFRHTTIRGLARFLATAGQSDGTLEASALRAASRRAAAAQRGRARLRV
jgi:natural product biosynthesis luciferase-like monooxygenase protein